jgi:DNA-binding MarR family transcriptional regulator
MNRSEMLSQLIESFEMTNRLMHRYFHDKFTGLGVALSQIKLLHALQTEQPATSRELSEKLYLTPGAVTQLVEPLVKAGFVVRTPDIVDRRSVSLTLSKAGEAKLADIRRMHKDMFQAVFETLDDTDLEILLRVQHKMATTLEESMQTQTKKTKNEKEKEKEKQNAS